MNVNESLTVRVGIDRWQHRNTINKQHSDYTQYERSPILLLVLLLLILLI